MRSIKKVEEAMRENLQHLSTDCEVRASATLKKFPGSPGAKTRERAELFAVCDDFSVKNIIGKSQHLSNVNIEKDMSMSIIKQLKSNKTLKGTLDNEETKDAFINALKSFISELEENK